MAFSFCFISPTKKLKENSKPVRALCSLQDFSRLGVAIDRNQLHSSAFGGLDSEGECDDPTAFCPLHRYQSHSLCSTRPHRLEANQREKWHIPHGICSNPP